MYSHLQNLPAELCLIILTFLGAKHPTNTIQDALKCYGRFSHDQSRSIYLIFERFPRVSSNDDAKQKFPCTYGAEHITLIADLDNVHLSERAFLQLEQNLRDGGHKLYVPQMVQLQQYMNPSVNTTIKMKTHFNLDGILGCLNMDQGQQQKNISFKIKILNEPWFFSSAHKFNILEQIFSYPCVQKVEFETIFTDHFYDDKSLSVLNGVSLENRGRLRITFSLVQLLSVNQIWPNICQMIDTLTLGSGYKEFEIMVPDVHQRMVLLQQVLTMTPNVTKLVLDPEAAMDVSIFGSAELRDLLPEHIVFYDLGRFDYEYQLEKFICLALGQRVKKMRYNCKICVADWRDLDMTINHVYQKRGLDSTIVMCCDGVGISDSISLPHGYKCFGRIGGNNKIELKDLYYTLASRQVKV